MGYLRHEKFMDLVEIVRHWSMDDRMDMLCQRIVEMDAMMIIQRQQRDQGYEPDEDFNCRMMEHWVSMAECARACNYLAREPQEDIPQVVREWLQSQVEQKVGYPVEITDFREISQEEYDSYMQAGPIGEMGNFEQRANPFFQADGTVYPAEDSPRERGTPGTRTVEKSIPGASDQLGEPFLSLFRSLEKGKNDSP